MDNLFEALLALPEIDNYNWDVCLFLLADERKKTATQFTYVLNQPEFLDIKNSLLDKGESIKNFMVARDKISSLCHVWYMILGMAWFQQTKKEMSADDAISLILEFLPHNPSLLEKLNASLTSIMRIEELGEKGLYFALFQSAIIIKLNPKKFAGDISPSMEQTDKVINTCKKVKEETDLNSLRFAVIDYLDFLKNRMQPLLSSTHYNEKRGEDNSAPSSIYAILERIKKGECSFVSTDKTIIYDIEKYFYLLEIKKNIFRECETQVMLDKFNKLYHLFIDVMNTSQSLKRQSYFFNKKCLHFLNINLLSSKEMIFLAKANEHVSKEKVVQACDLPEFSTSTDNYAEELKLKIKEIIGQSYYYKKSRVIEGDFFHEFINDIQTNHIPILFCNKEILILIEKYLIINDLQYSLARKNAEEFYQKLVCHIGLLNTKVEMPSLPQYSFFSNFGLSSFYYFAPPLKKENDVEQQFIKAANTVMTQTADMEVLFFGNHCA